MEHLPDDRVTIVLHTLGGCVTACVLIANALRQFRDSTAIVPYMAISGGTLIALSATRLEMGGRASLSAVDPQIMGQRVKHLAEGKDKPSIAALAREYDVSMRKYVRGALREHLPEDRLGPAMDLFLGEHSPHEWPIQRPEIEALGIPVTPAASQVGRDGRPLPGTGVVMDPFEQIDKFIERWRASLAPPFTPEYVDGFIRRHRAKVETLIAQTLARGGPGRRASRLRPRFPRVRRPRRVGAAPGRADRQAGHDPVPAPRGRPIRRRATASDR
jgi:hypothetical protein